MLGEEHANLGFDVDETATLRRPRRASQRNRLSETLAFGIRRDFGQSMRRTELAFVRFNTYT
jgi:hypothetical protein